MVQLLVAVALAAFVATVWSAETQIPAAFLAEMGVRAEDALKLYSKEELRCMAEYHKRKGKKPCKEEKIPRWLAAKTCAKDSDGKFALLDWGCQGFEYYKCLAREQGLPAPEKVDPEHCKGLTTRRPGTRS